MTSGDMDYHVENHANGLQDKEHVNDLIKRALKTAGILSIREPPGCLLSGAKRLDGLTILPRENH